MKAVRLMRAEPGAIEIVDLPRPIPGPGQALVKVC